MNHQHQHPTPHLSLSEMMDVCRAGEDDLALPEMSELAQQIQSAPHVHDEFQRIQQLDHSLGDAFLQAPVPSGLAERLLEKLEAKQLETGQLETTSGQEPVLTTPDTVDARQSRRFWTSISWQRYAAIATSLVLMFAIFVGGYAALERLLSPEVTSHELAVQAVENWVRQLETDSPGVWSIDFDVPQKKGYRMDSMNISPRPRRWRHLETRYDSHTVVYDIRPSANSPPAFLFAIRSSRRFQGLPTHPGSRDSTTQNWGVGSWRSSNDGDLVYVLAVQGGEERYDSFLKPNKYAALPTVPVSAYHL